MFAGKFERINIAPRDKAFYEPRMNTNTHECKCAHFTKRNGGEFLLLGDGGAPDGQVRFADGVSPYASVRQCDLWACG
jgi:hypothetical protein